MGGDCLNVGCVPSKALIAAARVAHTVSNPEAYGVEVTGDVKVNFGKVMTASFVFSRGDRRLRHETGSVPRPQPRDAVERRTNPARPRPILAEIFGVTARARGGADGVRERLAGLSSESGGPEGLFFSVVDSLFRGR